MQSIKSYPPTWQILLCAIALAVLGTVLASAARQSPPELKVYKAVAPVYPPIARAARAGGDVSVEVSVDRNGAVSSAHGTSGHPLLRAAAEATAKRWQFAPDAQGTNERKATLLLTFTMMPECAKYADLTPIFYPPYHAEVRAEPPQLICQDCGPQSDPCKNVRRY